MPMTKKTIDESPRRSGRQLVQHDGVHYSPTWQLYYPKRDTEKDQSGGVFGRVHFIINRTKGTEKLVDAEPYFKL
jgi:hypothetical protein